MAYLLEHPNRYHLGGTPHFYATRRGRVLAIVVHITAGLEDLDATDDHSAEQTARYAATTDRQVSWHSGSDADSAFDLLPAGYTAFHVHGYNSHTYGHEISKAHPDWRHMPEPWRTRTLTNAAQHLAPKAAELGAPRRHATRAELDHAIATGGAPVGFIGHWELDPDRRSDPGLVRSVGDTFPWTEFFALMGADIEEDPLAAFTMDDLIAAATAGTNRAHYPGPGHGGDPNSRTLQALDRVVDHVVEGVAARLLAELNDPSSGLSEAVMSRAASGVNRAHLDPASRTSRRLDKVVADAVAALQPGDPDEAG